VPKLAKNYIHDTQETCSSNNVRIKQKALRNSENRPKTQPGFKTAVIFWKCVIILSSVELVGRNRCQNIAIDVDFRFLKVLRSAEGFPNRRIISTKVSKVSTVLVALFFFREKKVMTKNRREVQRQSVFLTQCTRASTTRTNGGSIDAHLSPCLGWSKHGASDLFLHRQKRYVLAHRRYLKNASVEFAESLLVDSPSHRVHARGISRAEHSLYDFRLQADSAWI